MLSAFRQIAKKGKSAQDKVQKYLDTKDKHALAVVESTAAATAHVARATASSVVAGAASASAGKAQAAAGPVTMPAIFNHISECDVFPKHRLEFKAFEKH